MRPFERRQSAAYPYFKIATFDPISCTFRDGKRAFPSEDAARQAAASPGRYRVSRVDECARIDSEPFQVS